MEKKMNFKLREIQKEDVSIINNWRNDKELIDLLGNNFLFISINVDESWYENYMKNRTSAVRLAITENLSSKIIGTVQLTNIHPINKSAEFSIMVGDKAYWEKGAGSYATKEMLVHGFNNLNLHRIYLTVLDYNKRAIQLYEKVGFKKEGEMRDAMYKNGSFCNLIQMSILKSEFEIASRY